MVKVFHRDELGYRMWLKSGGGYVYTGSKLHRADCIMLHNTRPGSKKTNVRKICSSNLGELLEYNRRNGEEKGYSPCNYCSPLDTPTTEVVYDKPAK